MNITEINSSEPLEPHVYGSYKANQPEKFYMVHIYAIAKLADQYYCYIGHSANPQVTWKSHTTAYRTYNKDPTRRPCQYDYIRYLENGTTPLSDICELVILATYKHITFAEINARKQLVSAVYYSVLYGTSVPVNSESCADLCLKDCTEPCIEPKLDDSLESQQGYYPDQEQYPGLHPEQDQYIELHPEQEQQADYCIEFYVDPQSDSTMDFGVSFNSGTDMPIVKNNTPVQDYKSRRYYDSVSKGICGYSGCKEPCSKNRVYCLEHKLMYRRYNKRTIDRLKDRSKCFRKGCDEPLALASVMYCDTHLIMRRSIYKLRATRSILSKPSC